MLKYFLKPVFVYNHCLCSSIIIGQHYRFHEELNRPIRANNGAFDGDITIMGDMRKARTSFNIHFKCGGRQAQFIEVLNVHIIMKSTMR